METLYVMFSHYPCEPTERGRKQFFDQETYGRQPEGEPDPFYLCLINGKKWFNVQQSSIRDSYGTWEWWGFYQYWVDWKGNRWVLRHLMSWCPKVPWWLFSEDVTDDEITLGSGYIDLHENNSGNREDSGGPGGSCGVQPPGP